MSTHNIVFGEKYENNFPVRTLIWRLALGYSLGISLSIWNHISVTICQIGCILGINDKYHEGSGILFCNFGKGPSGLSDIGKIDMVNPCIGKFVIVGNYVFFGQYKTNKLAISHTFAIKILKMK